MKDLRDLQDLTIHDVQPIPEEALHLSSTATEREGDRLKGCHLEIEKARSRFWARLCDSVAHDSTAVSHTKRVRFAWDAPRPREVGEIPEGYIIEYSSDESRTLIFQGLGRKIKEPEIQVIGQKFRVAGWAWKKKKEGGFRAGRKAA